MRFDAEASQLFAARLQEFGHEARPAGLVRGADTAAVVAVEVFVEPEIVAEVRIGLQLELLAEYGPPPLGVAEKDPRQPAREFGGDLVERQHVARARGTFDL